MEYTKATALGRIRAMAAYMGIMVHDGLNDGTIGEPSVDDQAKWFNGEFTEEDAKRVLPDWERALDEEQGHSDWVRYTERHYPEHLANGAIEPRSAE